MQTTGSSDLKKAAKLRLGILRTHVIFASVFLSDKKTMKELGTLRVEGVGGGVGVCWCVGGGGVVPTGGGVGVRECFFMVGTGKEGAAPAWGSRARGHSQGSVFLGQPRPGPLDGDWTIITPGARGPRVQCSKCSDNLAGRSNNGQLRHNGNEIDGHCVQSMWECYRLPIECMARGGQDNPLLICLRVRFHYNHLIYHHRYHHRYYDQQVK